MFQFKVQFIEEIDDKCITEEGLISADNYVDAMQKLVDYFGKEIIEVSVSELESILMKDDLTQIFSLS